MQRFLEIAETLSGEGVEDRLHAMISLVNAHPQAAWWIHHASNTFQPLIPDCNSTIRKIVIAAAFA